MRIPLLAGALAAHLLVGCARLKPQQEEEAAIPATIPETTRAPATREFFKLQAEDHWRLDLPEGRAFDASGLIAGPDGVLVIADAIQTVFRIEPQGDHTARLWPSDFFTAGQLSPYATNAARRRVDFEGLARDEAGRIYACEEAERWVLRYDPATRRVERLDIDWTPVREYFSAYNRNASFEGIAVGGGKLWVANERERARVIEVDLGTLKVARDFAPTPSAWGVVLHYSDLCWFQGRLFVLARHHRVILEVDPESQAVVAEHNYQEMEDAREHEYRKLYPTGTMEGLAVDERHFWLVTDNNGFGRRAAPQDTRPTLFRCRRPNASVGL